MIDGDHDRVRLLQKFSSLITQLDYTVVLNVFDDEVVKKGLSQNRIPEVIIMLFATAKLIEHVMVEHHDLVVLMSTENVNHVINCETFLDGFYNLQQLVN